jgi:hypothetical protein
VQGSLFRLGENEMALLVITKPFPQHQARILYLVV